MITGFTLRSHAIRLTIANLLSCLRLASIPILLGVAWLWPEVLMREAIWVALLLLLNGHRPWLFRVGAVLVLVEAVEEVAITHTLKRWRADVPSWWHVRRE
jgi:hypothetical protein